MYSHMKYWLSAVVYFSNVGGRSVNGVLTSNTTPDLRNVSIGSKLKLSHHARLVLFYSHLAGRVSYFLLHSPKFI